jgi:type IV secretion system protein VirB11
MAMMSLAAGTELDRTEVVDYVRATVDVFVQLEQSDGQRLVSEVKFNSRA